MHTAPELLRDFGRMKASIQQARRYCNQAIPQGPENREARPEWMFYKQRLSE
jgi:hypothetical protein